MPTSIPRFFFAPDFFFAVFGFGVGVWRRFVFGVGDFFGFGVDCGACLGFLGLIAPFFFIDLRAKETRDQCAKCERSCEPKCESAPLRRSVTEPAMRSTLTAADLLKKLQNTKSCAFSPLLSVNFYVFVDEASGAAGAGATGWATRIF